MKILIIEDDKSLVATLKEFLEQEGYFVDYFHNLDDIEDYVILNKYNLIILDVMLGERNGFEFLQIIRGEIDRPIILLTAKDTKEDMLKGFGLGADDYVTKPFDADLLLARIKSHLRGKKNEEVRHFDTFFDLSTGVIKKDDNSTSLTNAELEIVKLLYENKGQIFSKERIVNRVCSKYDATNRVVVCHIYNIRKKLSEIDGDDHIKNRWGVGYLWKEQ